jgi:exoribonuclease-2
LALRLRAQRVRNGAVTLERDDLELRVSPGGDVSVRKNPSDSSAHALVSELMILVNVTVARFFEERGLPSLFRHQPSPASRPPSSADFPHPALAFDALRRLLATPATGPDPRPHYGLGVGRYVQATSPIRRYGDLAVQRALAAALSGAGSPPDRASVASLGAALDRAARRAAIAEQERRDHWILRFLERTAGDPRDAVVLEDPDRGRAMVELQDCFLRSPVRFRAAVRAGDVAKVRVGGVDVYELRARIWEVRDPSAAPGDAAAESVDGEGP